MRRAGRLVVQAALVGCLAAPALAQPREAAGCDYGFRPWGPRCTPVHLPRDAEMDAAGHGWICVEGFRRISEGCLPDRAAAAAPPVRAAPSALAPPVPASPAQRPCATWLDEPDTDCVAPGRV